MCTRNNTTPTSIFGTILPRPDVTLTVSGLAVQRCEAALIEQLQGRSSATASASMKPGDNDREGRCRERIVEGEKARIQAQIVELCERSLILVMRDD